MAKKYDPHPHEHEPDWSIRLGIMYCPECHCPMKPKGVRKKPCLWNHASGCPRPRATKWITARKRWGK